MHFRGSICLKFLLLLTAPLVVLLVLLDGTIYESSHSIEVSLVKLLPTLLLCLSKLLGHMDSIVEFEAVGVVGSVVAIRQLTSIFLFKLFFELL